MAAAVSTADHCQAGPDGRRGFADLPLATFLAGFATAPLRAPVLIAGRVAAFFPVVLVLIAVFFFATPHLLKLRGGG
jgi:hypothetical protein